MSGQSTHPFTCNTCQVAFRSSDLQRTHMQSDWHRYNLKRRVASLPPLSSEVFNEKVLANRADAAATAARASFEKICEPCRKSFYSENAFVNHLSSQKHKSNAARYARSGKRDDDAKSVMSSTFSLGQPASTRGEVDSDAEEEFQEVLDGIRESNLEDDDEPVSRRPTRPHHSSASQDQRPEHPLSPSTSSAAQNGRVRDPLKECLFCSQHEFGTLEESLDHMNKVHGMFIPERNFVVDLEGLITYLHGKVNEEHQCLYCGRLKYTEDGIKTHMRDTEHCKIAYEDEDAQLEIGGFYDFRSTYSDDEWEDSEEEEVSDEGAAPGGGVKLGAKRRTKTEVDGSEEGEGWETDSTLSSVPTEELGRIYVDPQANDDVKTRLRTSRHHNHSSKSSERHRSTDGFHSHAHYNTNAVYHDDFELHLPSGRTAGHRSLNKIWRQNLRSYPNAEEREQRLLTAGDSSADEKDAVKKPSEAAKERERGRAGALLRREQALGVVGLSEEAKRGVLRVENRERRKGEQRERKVHARVERAANNQKHFRDPLLQ